MASIVAWLLTYAVHSTLLLGLAVMLTRFVRESASVSWIWKTALVGALLTTSSQRAGVGGPAASFIQVAPPSPRAVHVGVPIPHAPRFTAHAVASDASEGIGAMPAAFGAPALSGGSQAETLRAPAVADSNAEVRPAWVAWVFALWFAGALVGAQAIALAYVDLRRQTRGRVRIEHGALFDILERLCAAAGVRRRIRIYWAPSLAVPLAAGVVRPAIYVPPRVLDGLSARAQEALIAHELAHILRHDPLWRLVGVSLQEVLFFQPLHRIALRRLARATEIACDDWAAAQTRAPFALAACLTEVAGWMVRDSRLAAGMAGTRSVLAERVYRLVGTRPEPRPKFHRPASWLISLGVFMVATWTLPGAAFGRSRRPRAVRSGAADKVAIELEVGPEGERIDSNDFIVAIRSSSESSVAPAKPRKREVARMRRKAKREVRKAFAEARKRGEPMPSPAELHIALSRVDPGLVGPRTLALSLSHADGDGFALSVAAPLEFAAASAWLEATAELSDAGLATKRRAERRSRGSKTSSRRRGRVIRKQRRGGRDVERRVRDYERELLKAQERALREAAQRLREQKRLLEQRMRERSR